MIKLFIIQAEIIYDQKKNPESKIQSLNAGVFFFTINLKNCFHFQIFVRLRSIGLY